jgi:small redox-active disulfide protein 2
MDIKVLGTGCPKCEQVVKIVKKTIDEVKIEASVEKITDIMKIAGYGVLTMPAVVINGEVKSAGKIPSKDEIKEWLEK